MKYSFSVNIGSIEKVKRFFDLAIKQDYEIYLGTEEYNIDASSIMGIFSLDLSKDIEVILKDETKIDNFRDTFEQFIVSERLFF